MSVIKLNPKTKKPALKVEYDGNTYVLPGHVSASMVESILKPRAEGTVDGVLQTFLDNVVPKDFKDVLAEADMGDLLTLWLGHINGPKDSGSKS